MLNHCSEQYDCELWQRILRDDMDAFAELVERHKGSVSAVAYSILGELGLSQDVAQETFWTAWRNRGQLREPERLASWLCGIARNMARQSQKKNFRDRQWADVARFDVSSTESDPALCSITAEENQLVWNTIESLPENYREALVIYYRQGESVADVAAALDISLDATKQRLSRGREMLRSQLSELVEGVLERSRPSHVFTSRVLAGIAVLSASAKGVASVSGATLAIASSTAAKAASTGLAAGAAKTATGWLGAGSMAGLAGSMVGVIGGLGGAWLGTWLPAQMAPTLAQRRLVEKHGRRILILGIALTFVMLLLAFMIPRLGMTSVYILIGSLVLFGITLSILVVQMTIELIKLLAIEGPDSPPNPSSLRRRVGRWKGKRYTSSAALFGIPLLDIQFQDSGAVERLSKSVGEATDESMKTKPRRAFGWVAIGDRATGLILAFGGIARGMIAFGGVAVGGLAFGGAAIGLIGLGGGAIGILSFGGAAIGWDAAGGLALAWNSSAGGLAIAREIALGGGAFARQVVPHELVAQAISSNKLPPEVLEVRLAWLMFGIIKHQALFLVITILVSVLPGLIMLMFYRREDVSEGN